MSDPIRSISQNNYLLSNGGGGHEYSGANGVYVDNVNEVIGLDTSASNAIETVIENSGAWGGAGLRISAGPGVKLELVDGTLVASTDETLLFSGSNAWGYGNITLSESLKNFKRIKVLATRAYTTDGNTDKYSGPWCEFECDGIANTTAAWGAVTPAIYEGPWWKFSTFAANSTFTELNWVEGGYIKITDPSDHGSGTSWNDGKSCGIKAVIGIDRIAGGN